PKSYVCLCVARISSVIQDQACALRRSLWGDCQSTRPGALRARWILRESFCKPAASNGEGKVFYLVFIEERDCLTAIPNGGVSINKAWRAARAMDSASILL